MVSPFREVIQFFDGIGLFDVVLPFLLVFTIVFAIFEKTKVLGTEEIEGHKYTKGRNLRNHKAYSSFKCFHHLSKMLKTNPDWF